ncbi:MAG TPA: thiamine diphosphokinase [Acidimicrobiia bacterium]|nr:thiamine diphosphokinase [Acidimicrobiia bacterium]
MNARPSSTALVFAGGDPLPPELARRLPGDDALVVAADSGLEHALALARDVDLVVGDMDSADPEIVAAAELAGATIERHPVAKDRTDLELALGAARARGATRIVVVGGYGGRLDHFLANALVLAGPAADDVAVEWVTGEALVTVVRPEADIAGEPGDLCSLLAVGGPARGVRTKGLRYPLAGEDLAPGSTRGVSNELTEPVAHVSVEAGTVLAVQPGRG